MKNSLEISKKQMKKILVVAFLLSSIFSFAQVRIDWQQCYGNEGSTDYASSIAPTKDGFIVVGQIEKPLHQGLCSCAVNDLSTPWMIQIDNQGEMEWQQCWTDLDNVCEYKPILIRKAKSPEGKDEYYLSTHFLGYVTITKVDEDGEELWRRKNSYFGNYIYPTEDGGVVLDGSYGPIDKYIVDSLIKLDSQGKLEWGLTLQEGDNYTEGVSVFQVNDGGYYALAKTSTGACFYRISSNGDMERSYKYGSNFKDLLLSMVELEDGFLLAGRTSSEMNEQHGKTDIWVVRINKEGEVQWSKCYGGSSYEYFCGVFHNLNGGFTLFANSKSNDGDVQSNSQGETEVYKIWVFHINATGDLVWEHCIGSDDFSVQCNDVIQTDNYRYMLAGWTWNNDIPSGDVNCSNSQLLPNSKYNYWVLQVTDTINNTGLYDPMSPIKMQVFPNPTNSIAFIQGVEPTVVQVYDVLGQWVKTLHNTNEIPLGDLPKGMYLIKAVLDNGNTYTKKVMKE